MKKLVLFISLLLPLSAFAQLPSVKDTTLITPSTAVTPQWRYSYFGGDMILQSFINGKYYHMPTNKYLSKYFTTGAKTQAKLDSIYARLLNLYDDQTAAGTKTYTGQAYFNNDIHFGTSVFFNPGYLGNPDPNYYPVNYYSLIGFQNFDGGTKQIPVGGDKPFHVLISDASGNNPPTKGFIDSSYVKYVQNISDLQAYAGLNPVQVTGARGGVFTYSATGTVDNGITFTRSAGGYWVRKYNIASGVNVEWWGANTVAIQKAVAAAGVNGIINFTPNYTYLQTDEIIPLIGQVLNGNNATLQRQFETSVLTTTTLNSTDNTITVASIPSTWKVGDFLQVYTNQSTSGSSLRRKITAISGNTVTLEYAIGTQQITNATSWATGASVRKVFNQITGVINTAISSNGSLLSSDFEVNNLNFDGQLSINSQNIYWGVNNAIFAQSFNQHIRIIGCRFVNMPNDIINGHGLYITKCYVSNSNNSFVHLSGDFTSSPQQIDSHIFDNSTESTNQILSATGSYHSEGVITLSFTSGYVSIHHNNFKGGLDAALGTISYSATANNGATRYLIFDNNKCYNFSAIFSGFSLNGGGQLLKPGYVKIHDNIFSNCGANTPFPATGSSNWNLIDKITWDNNTLADGTTITLPIEVLNTTEYIANNSGATTQTGAIKINGNIAGANGSFTAGLSVTGGTTTVQNLTATGDHLINSATTATGFINYIIGGLGQAGSSLATMRAKNTSRGNTINSLSSSTSLFLQGPGTPDNVTSIRPEVSFYRGSNANPEGGMREHTNANNGFELFVSNGSVVPAIVAEGKYAAKPTFQVTQNLGLANTLSGTAGTDSLLTKNPTTNIVGRIPANYYATPASVQSATTGAEIKPYRQITSTTTVLATDYTINVTSGTFTQALPTTTLSAGQLVNIKNTGTGVVTVTATSIDGQTSIQLQQYDGLTLQYTGVSGVYIIL